jgi:ABC-type branched-subunit amino acid transport system ATPase component
MWGPVVGAIALALIPWAASLLGDAVGTSAETFEPVVTGLLLFTALIVGRGGVVRLLDRRPDAPPRPGPGAPLGAWSSAAEAARLEARGLTKNYGGVTALDDVSLEVVPGTVTALIGPNGSGKSTCLRVLSGAVQADSGSVLLDERELPSGTEPRLRSGIARTLQRTEVFPEMTVLEHVLAASAIRRRYGGGVRNLFATPAARRETGALKERGLELLGFAGLRWAAGERGAALSSGEQRLLMVVLACAAEPRVLLLDEPAAGMSHEYTARLRSLLEGLRGGGLGILLVEHDLGLVRSVSDRVLVLSAGKIIAEGTPREVAADPQVIETYLGAAHL